MPGAGRLRERVLPGAQAQARARVDALFDAAAAAVPAYVRRHVRSPWRCLERQVLGVAELPVDVWNLCARGLRRVGVRRDLRLPTLSQRRLRRAFEREVLSRRALLAAVDESFAGLDAALRAELGGTLARAFEAESDHVKLSLGEVVERAGAAVDADQSSAGRIKSGVTRLFRGGLGAAGVKGSAFAAGGALAWKLAGAGGAGAPLWVRVAGGVAAVAVALLLGALCEVLVHVARDPAHRVEATLKHVRRQVLDGSGRRHEQGLLAAMDDVVAHHVEALELASRARAR